MITIGVLHRNHPSMPHDLLAVVMGWVWACGAAATVGCLGFLVHEATHQDQPTAQPSPSALDAPQHDEM